MLALRRLLVVLCVVLSGVAYALTPGERVVLFSAIKPVWTANFLSPALVASQILPSGLTYTKSGSIPATLFDSTGKLTYQANNILVYTSNDISMSQWQVFQTTKGTEATANPFSASSVAYINSNNGVTSGGSVYQTQNFNPVNFITTFVVKARGAQRWVYIGTQDGGTKSFQWFDLVNGVAGSAIGNAASPTITSLGNGFYRVSTKTSFTGGAAYVGVALGVATADGSQNSDGVTTNGAYFYTASCAAVTYETTPRSIDQQITTSSIYFAPRLDTNPSTLAPAGLLVEEQRVQYALQSNAFNNAVWPNSVTTITLNSTTSPDGTTNAAKFVWQTGQTVAYIYQTGLPNAAGTWTFSVYAKTAGFAGLRLDVYNPTDGESFTNFDVSAGTITSGSGTITSIGNGWYRCSKTYTTTTGTSTQVQIRNVQTGDGTNGIYVYGAQFEAGSFPTSYIPNPTASTVTRTADVVTFNGVPLAALQGASGALFVETGSFANKGAAYSVFVGNASSFMSDVYNSQFGVSAFRSSGDFYNAAAITTTNINRFASSWTPSGVSLVSNGGSVASTTGTAGITGTIYLGSYQSNTAVTNGWFRSLGIYNQPLPNARLKAVSTAGASFAANDNGFPRYAENDNLPIIWNRRAM